jgi:hypothetical protein
LRPESRERRPEDRARIVAPSVCDDEVNGRAMRNASHVAIVKSHRFGQCGTLPVRAVGRLPRNQTIIDEAASEQASWRCVD